MTDVAEVQYSSNGQTKRCGDGEFHKHFLPGQERCVLIFGFPGESPNGSLQHRGYGRQAAGGRSAPIQPFTWK